MRQEQSAACAACGAADGRMSRCGVCKWVAYCSRACQTQHWTALHRRLCRPLQQISRMRALESDWWRSRPHAELHAFELETGLQAESMSFYGEVLFLLLELKCCVLFSNLPVSWRSSFATDVLIKSGLLGQPASRQASTCVPGLYRIREHAQTPAEYDLSGDLVLANTAHEAFAYASQALGLESLEQAALPSSSDVLIVSEAALARVLDYPVALDQCRGDMIEVGYFHVSGKPFGDITTPPPDVQPTRSTLLTSYCASADDATQAARIQMHFRRYQAHVHGTAIQLQLQQTQI